MLYYGFTDEEELGADDEQKCLVNYLENETGITFVKQHLLPYMEGIEEARHYVEESMADQNNIGKILDPEQEQEIEECQEEDELMHPDFEHLNPDDFEIDSNLQQMRKISRNIQTRTEEERLIDARRLDINQNKMLLLVPL